MERMDLYDAQRRPLGRTAERGGESCPRESII